jgi:hypothetical protein
MLPTQAANGSLQTLTLDGSPVTFDTETIKGISYAIFDAAEPVASGAPAQSEVA